MWNPCFGFFNFVFFSVSQFYLKQSQNPDGSQIKYQNQYKKTPKIIGNVFFYVIFSNMLSIRVQLECFRWFFPFHFVWKNFGCCCFLRWAYSLNIYWSCIQVEYFKVHAILSNCVCLSQNESHALGSHFGLFVSISIIQKSVVEKLL